MTDLPGSFVWRGIELARVVHTERVGCGLFAYEASRAVERPSNPPVFSGTVGCWRYTLERQANGTWIGKIYMGSTSNADPYPFSDFRVAMDNAAEWWAEAVEQIPAEPTAGVEPAHKLLRPCADGDHKFEGNEADINDELCSRCGWTRGEVIAGGHAVAVVASEPA